MNQTNEAIKLCQRLLHPEDLGHAVTQEVRQEARRALQAAGMGSADNLATGKPVKVYLAGPMTGLPDYNYPAFFTAAELLRERGLIVENPAEHAQRNPQPSWGAYMRQALKVMLECEELYLLPGWGISDGANLEHGLVVDLNMPVHYPEDWMDALGVSRGE